MRILAIETSCDETAVALLEINPVRSRSPLDNRSRAFSRVASNGVKESKKVTEVEILGNALLSQTAIHAPMGGVVPSLAKREHSNNLIPILQSALKEAKYIKKKISEKIFSKQTEEKLKKMLSHEPDLYNAFVKFVPTIQKPNIDVIAVTSGPGLEPALWVGINFAQALSLVWDKPVVAVNHMEGHILSAMLEISGMQSVKRKASEKSVHATRYTLHATQFPILSLLISGGHTELVLAKKFGSYKIIGETRDDAIGEAYDKVARMLGLPYPGGPEISKLAEVARAKNIVSQYPLPRPMIKSGDLDFSFAGLKTAVLYTIKKNFKESKENVYDISNTSKMMIAREFEEAVAEVLVSKVRQALEKTGAKTFAVGGGVIANKNIRAKLSKLIKTDFPQIKLFLPAQNLTTDNAVMIALAGYFSAKGGSSFGGKKSKTGSKKIVASGNWRLG